MTFTSQPATQPLLAPFPFVLGKGWPYPPGPMRTAKYSWDDPADSGLSSDDGGVPWWTEPYVLGPCSVKPNTVLGNMKIEGLSSMNHCKKYLGKWLTQNFCDFSSSVLINYPFYSLIYCEHIVIFHIDKRKLLLQHLGIDANCKEFRKKMNLELLIMVIRLVYGETKTTFSNVPLGSGFFTILHNLIISQ